MKLRAPKGCSSVSHGGRILKIAADGSLDIEDEAAEVLAAHGFQPWEEDTGAAEGIEAFPGDDFESLNRKALFALLRKRGVRVALPITNAELRAAARRALAD